jgi:two-component system, OmpR family, response regulator
MAALRILVDVANGRLSSEVVAALARAGHTIVRATRDYDLALVGSAEAAETLRRERPAAAIIVVTKLGDVPARVRALEAGADDAFDCGFAMSQIVARVDSAGRRAAMTPPPPERLLADGCTVDLSAATATRDGLTTELTTRELEIIRWLAARAGQVVARAELLQHVWRVAAGSNTRAVDVAISELRAKLERDPAEPKIITSVRGAGYRWILTNG